MPTDARRFFWAPTGAPRARRERRSPLVAASEVVIHQLSLCWWVGGGRRRQSPATRPASAPNPDRRRGERPEEPRGSACADAGCQRRRYRRPKSATTPQDTGLCRSVVSSIFRSTKVPLLRPLPPRRFHPVAKVVAHARPVSGQTRGEARTQSQGSPSSPGDRPVASDRAVPMRRSSARGRIGTPVDATPVLA